MHPNNPRPEGLTARQEAFCQEFAKTRSLRAAYAAAYNAEGMDPRKVTHFARATYDSQNVKARIAELIEAGAQDTVTTVGEVLRRYLLIATADPNELMSVKTGCCRYCHGDAHGYQWRVREYEEAMDRADRINEERRTAADGRAFREEPYPDPGGGFGFDATREPHPFCPECHGEGLHRVVVKDTDQLSPAGRALFGGVKMTAQGPQIIMADQVKALEAVGRILGAFKDDSPKTLQVELKGMTQVVRTEAKDPREAARLYQDMIAGKLS